MFFSNLNSSEKENAKIENEEEKLFETNYKPPKETNSNPKSNVVYKNYQFSKNNEIIFSLPSGVESSIIQISNSNDTQNSVAISFSNSLKTGEESKKGRGHISSLACENCRTKHIKCTAEPSGCATCQKYNMTWFVHILN